MNEQPFVKVSAGFYLKNAPKGYLGLRNEQWNFGNKPVTLDGLICSIVFRLCQFYAHVMPDDLNELNISLKKAGKAIMDLQFEELDVTQGKGGEGEWIS